MPAITLSTGGSRLRSSSSYRVSPDGYGEGGTPLDSADCGIILIAEPEGQRQDLGVNSTVVRVMVAQLSVELRVRVCDSKSNSSAGVITEPVDAPRSQRGVGRDQAVAADHAPPNVARETSGANGESGSGQLPRAVVPTQPANSIKT